MENEKWEKFKDLIKKISSVPEAELLEFKKIILNEIETRDASGEIKKIYLIKILDQPDHLIYYYSNFDNLSTDSVLKEIYYHLKRNYKFYRFSRNKILDIKIGDMDINLKWNLNISFNEFMDQIDLNDTELDSIHDYIEIYITKVPIDKLREN